eukprot:TRINITY_DN18253_c0_g1_i3.p1 TRINITY_DN18253_c0_g1~~TRINITY_DN18253_c0_g1_i3.p1  ORF type:complete len:292 (+),score=52.08 TRINITY_DN18253_c0_g1_i3:94-969(+)
MHPNLVTMYEGFKRYDQGGTGTVRDEVFLRQVRDASGEVPSVETLLPQFRSKVYPGRVDYLGFIEHLNVLVSKQVTQLKEQSTLPSGRATPMTPTNFVELPPENPVEHQLQTQILLHQRQQHTPPKRYALPVSQRRQRSPSTPQQQYQPQHQNKQPQHHAQDSREYQTQRERGFLEPAEDERPSVIPMKVRSEQPQTSISTQPLPVKVKEPQLSMGSSHPLMQSRQDVEAPQPQLQVHSVPYGAQATSHANTNQQDEDRTPTRSLPAQEDDLPIKALFNHLDAYAPLTITT